MPAILRTSRGATRRLIEKVYRHMARAKYEEAVAEFAPDYRWAMAAPPHLFGPPVEGPQNALITLTGHRRRFEVLSMENELAVCDLRSAALELEIVLRERESGHGSVLRVCALVTLNRSGQIASIRDYLDTATAMAHLAGFIPELRI